MSQASLFLGLMAAVTLMSDGAATSQETDRKGTEFFETKIRPALAKHCYKCHSDEADAPKAGLRLDTVRGIKQGGRSGQVVEPGEVDKSRLIRAIRREGPEMPPDGRLPEETIEDFVAWVKMGAPLPEPKGDLAKTDGTFWSFQPPTKPAPPEVKNGDWPRSNIDRFVLARLEEQGLQPVGDAGRQTLIRRAYFDLIGLPPEPEKVASFVNDSSPHAFRKLVDRLLASRHFGERWGRHWLDVARYAESTGHERNFTFPHAWRYRDWVIESFNEDKPYDQFIREQIAGDLLPAENWKEAQEQAVGTGFLALGPKDLIMGNDRQYRADVIDDQINVTTRAILGVTAACARCHDHKFDPIPNEDYYALAGIFKSTQPLYGTVPGSGGGNNRHPSPLLPIGPEAEKRHQAYQKFQQKKKDLSGKLDKTKKQLRQARKKDQKEKVARLKKQVDDLQSQLKKLKQNAPEPPPYAMAVRDKQEPSNAYLLKRGNVRNRGDKIPRGFLSAVSWEETPDIEKDESGRLALARWLTSRRNPLTARVLVNRVWHHLFGRGLVRTVDNFGRTGAKPSHPKLLDYLAVTFMEEDDWSIKQFIRRIMLSRVYQLSSNTNARNYEADPQNVLLWRMSPKRLEAEALRDAMLAVSGQLDRSSPPFGSVVAKLGNGCLVRQIDVDKLKVESNRRSIYQPNCRHFQPEIMEIFDGAPASLVVGNRDETNVPAQSLFLMNNEFVLEQSRHAARRLLEDGKLDDPGRVDRAFRRTFARPPTQTEKQQTLDYIRRLTAESAKQDKQKTTKERRLKVWTSFCQALFTSAEFRYVY